MKTVFLLAPEWAGSATILIALLVIVAIIAVSRGIMMWWIGTSEIIKNQHRQIELAQKLNAAIADYLKTINPPKPPTPPTP